MRRKRKWIATLIAITLFLLLGEFLPEEPLRSKAMVVGFGIDYPKDQTVSIHLQILTGSGNKTETRSNTRMLSAEGSTLGEAAYKISRESGLSVSFTHCNVVLIGESLLKSPVLYATLNYLVSSAYLSDNACLIACQGSAGDYLSAPVGFGENAGIYIREIIGMYDRFGDIVGTTVRKYVVDYHRLGQTVWIPFMTKKAIDPIIPTPSSDKKEDDYLFEMNKVAVLTKDRFIGIWEENGTVGINCLLNKISKAQFRSDGDHGEKIDWYVLKNKSDLRYDLEKKTVTAELKLQALVKEIIDYSGNSAHVDRLTVTDSEIARLESMLTDLITSFYLETQSKNADVFGFCEAFFDRYPRRAKDLPLSEIKLDLSVKVQLT